MLGKFKYLQFTFQVLRFRQSHFKSIFLLSILPHFNGANGADGEEKNQFINKQNDANSDDYQFRSQTCIY